jgi:hypothetical protein
MWQEIPLTLNSSVWFKVDKDEHPKMPIPNDLRDMGFYLFAFEDSSLGRRLLWASNGENGTSKPALPSSFSLLTEMLFPQLDLVSVDLGYPLKNCPGQLRS